MTNRHPINVKFIYINARLPNAGLISSLAFVVSWRRHASMRWYVCILHRDTW